MFQIKLNSLKSTFFNQKVTSGLYNDLKFVQEDQLVRVLEKNTELTIQNKDLQKQVQRLQNVSIYYIYIELKWV